MKEFKEYAKNNPMDYCRGLIYKTFQFFSSREIPRNVDIYTLRKHSVMLSALVWKSGSFGFPFGFILPFALLGLVCQWKKMPFLLKAFLIVYPLSVILVFVSARYRVPVIPILAVCAAAGIESFISALRKRKYSTMILMLALFLPLIALSYLYPSWPQEQTNYEAEMHCVLGIQKMEQGHNSIALEHFEKAIEIDPDYKTACSLAGLALSKNKQFDRAYEYHRKVLQLDPDCAKGYNYLGLSLALAGRYEEAIENYRKATQIDSYLDDAYYSWGQSLTQLGRAADAIEIYKKALNMVSRNDMAGNLALILAVSEDDSVRNGEEAVYFAEFLCTNTSYKDPEGLYILSAAYAESGRLDDAVETANKALQLAADKADEKLFGDVQRALELYRKKRPLRLTVAELKAW